MVQQRQAKPSDDVAVAPAALIELSAWKSDNF
jgi:hypothetical protein